MRPLVGEPASLIAAAIVLFLGFAYEVLLFDFQITYTISISTGLGALIYLKRRNPEGDRKACALLVLSLLAGTVGLIFIWGASVALFLRKPRTRASFLVILVPAAVYVLWWLGWGHTASNGVTFTKFEDSPAYVFHAFQVAMSGLTGSFRISGDPGIWVIRIAVLTFVLIIGLRFWKTRKVSPEFWSSLAMAIGFWELAALNQWPGLRDYFTSRYQYMAVIFLLMILAGAFDGFRPKVRTLTWLATLGLLSIAANIFQLSDGYCDAIKVESDRNLAAVSAVQLTRNSVDPDFAFMVSFQMTTARNYFDAVDRYGNPAWSDFEILEQSPDTRITVDQLLTQANP